MDEIVEEVKIGTTIGTNALLENKGAKTALIVTKGYKDLLEIGHQNRQDLFSLDIKNEKRFWEKTFEIDGRINSFGKVIKVLEKDQLKAFLESSGMENFDSIAIALINSYINPAHERLVTQELNAMGINNIVVSHLSSPMIGYVDRANTAVVDAYLLPILQKYVGSLKNALGRISFSIMQSHGGLTDAENFQGRNSILSGPAGGVIGAVKTAKRRGFSKIICFDMGGTSTDVAHYNDNYEYRSQSKIESIAINSNSMDIHTVAAGGGSIVEFDGIRYKVGPESGGAYPGPACYGNGGPVTVTDCNVLLGIVRPEFFPALFGKNKKSKINRELVISCFEKFAASARDKFKEKTSIFQIAEGFLELAVEKMANAIKKISIDKGHDIKDYVLNCYGGAAAQHCCAVADSLGIKKILISKNASVLSALGIGLSDRQTFVEESINKVLSSSSINSLQLIVDKIIKKSRLSFKNPKSLRSEIYLKLKYEDTLDAIPIALSDMKTMKKKFTNSFSKSYGFTEPEKKIFIDSVLVKTIESSIMDLQSLAAEDMNHQKPQNSVVKERVFENGRWKYVPFYQLQDLSVRTSLVGPVIIISSNNTVFIRSGWACDCLDNHDLLVKKISFAEQKDCVQKIETSMEVSIYGNQIVSIAEQMGSALRKTASSINIKERLDYSCAIFDGEGCLLASAPHIPVHLGSMSDCVKSLIQNQSVSLRSGQTYVTNDPFEGGTHLPDITLISPVFFSEMDETPVFFVASRGHHADVGGITPGSMPAKSSKIQQEGVLLKTMLVVEDNIFKEEEITSIFLNSDYPARNIPHNIADLKAQIAANQTGINEIQNKLFKYNKFSINHLSKSLLNQGELFIRKIIPRLESGAFGTRLDEEGDIHVKINVDKKQKRLFFDFVNTSKQLASNFNAPKSITKACIIYVLRSLISDSEIPLNDGCLVPVTVNLPRGSMLDPAYPAAVVAGNVEISQKIVDIILAAFGLQAFSQGTMNNLSFGNSSFQYYETICGGSGAGKTYDGTSARQTHMTNSRITDPEVMERHFPILLEEFSIRRNSGGKGVFNGGNGVVRKIRFLEPVALSILSSSRVNRPRGLNGAQDGLAGKNFYINKAGKQFDLPSCAQIEIDRDECILIYTPGGGGFGKP